jgi:CubicO group peptidase (beta-lactamase class C family)
MKQLGNLAKRIIPALTTFKSYSEEERSKKSTVYNIDLPKFSQNSTKLPTNLDYTIPAYYDNILTDVDSQLPTKDRKYKSLLSEMLLKDLPTSEMETASKSSTEDNSQPPIEEKRSEFPRTAKYHQDLSILSDVSSNSPEEEKNRESHIMSVSKSFCGATAALMAVDGKFGPKKMQASLAEVLDEARKSAASRYSEIEEDPNETIENLAKAKKEYSLRIEKIEKYEEAIAEKGCSDVTMSEILSHRSGLVQQNSYFEQGNLSSLEVFASEAVTFDRARKDNTWSYCNPGFVLAEDLMSLASDSNEGYYEELKNRIIKPLELDHTKSVYESEEAKGSIGDTVVIEGVMYNYGVKSKKTERSNFLNATQKGELGLSEGGLCSSINDLETFYEELSKTACGIPSKLTPDPEKAKEVHELYLDSYKTGESSISDSKRELSIRCASGYSLGIIIEAVDEKGEPVPNKGNEDKRVSLWHIGGRPGSSSSVTAIMPFSLADFTSGTAQLKEGERPELNASVVQRDTLVEDSLLTMVSCDYIAKMDEYFSGRCDKATDKSYNDVDDKGVNWRTYNQYWEAARDCEEDYVAKKWQSDLIKKTPAIHPFTNSIITNNS